MGFKLRALMYHDIVGGVDPDESGFPGKGAAEYKLTAKEFERHLKAISHTAKIPPVSIEDVIQSGDTEESWLLTFDDGGVGAYLYASDLLERFNWRGHFFVTTNHIGQRSFLSGKQIRELRDRGHVIGSHSCSHPSRMDRLKYEEIVAEWRRSLSVLSDVIGEGVRTASVPAGFYTTRIARAAGEAGIKVLFTSAPGCEKKTVGECLILGRYTVRRKTAPSTVAALTAGKMAPHLQQVLLWEMKRIPKLLPEHRYEQLARLLRKR